MEVTGERGTETPVCSLTVRPIFCSYGQQFLKVAPSDMAFTKLKAECILIFGTRSKKAVKTPVSTNDVKKLLR